MYRKLHSKNQIVFAPLTENPFKLIDRSKGVATITGTVGIEALFRNKPVLLFGKPWYRFHESLNYISTEIDLKRQINSIVNEDYCFNEKLKRSNNKFLACLEEISYPGFVGRVSKHYRENIYGNNSNSFAKIIESTLKDQSNNA